MAEHQSTLEAQIAELQRMRFGVATAGPVLVALAGVAFVIWVIVNV
jgi:hypothetical protein